jgi:general secretion pathway protein A
MERQPVKVHCVHLHNPTLSKHEFNEMLAGQFGLSAQAVQSKAAMLGELETLLLSRQAEDEKTVLIVDEAQSLPMELLEEIRLLANIETNNEKLLSVIIAGQPELAVRLNERALRQFKQRVALRCELRPLTAQETAAYIVGRIKAAGGVAAEVFTRQAVAMMHERAHGIPRTISVIADNALLAGYASGQRPVGVDMVTEICRDFDLHGPSVATPAPTRPPTPAPAPAAPPPSASSSATQGTGKLLSVDALIQQRKEEAQRAADSGMFGALSSKRKKFSFFWS